MAYIERYITFEEYLDKSFADNSRYEGFIIGFGYVFTKAVVVQPLHMNGYNLIDSKGIPVELTYNKIVYERVEDRSEKAIKLSLRGLFVNGEAVVTIKAGMTLSHIAAIFDVDIADIIRWNSIVDPDKIYVGQMITIVDKTYRFVESVMNNITLIRTSAVNDKISRSSFLFTSKMEYTSVALAAVSAGTSVYSSIPYNAMRLANPNVLSIKYSGGIFSANMDFLKRYDMLPLERAKYLKQLKWLSGIKGTGVRAGVLGVGLSAAQWYYAETPAQQAEALFDTFMGGVGMTGVGWPAAAMYSLTKPLQKIWAKKVLEPYIDAMNGGVIHADQLMPFK